jgi:hypothetical protein
MSWRVRGVLFDSRFRPVSDVAPFWWCMLRRVDFLDAGTLGGVSSKANIAFLGRADSGDAAALFLVLVFLFFFAVPDRCASYR